MTVEQFREKFPILGMKDAKGNPLVYLDNAATSQRPLEVVQAQQQAALEYNANIHRAVHSLSSKATDAYEASRDAAKSFLNAAFREEIIFTSGDTAAINLAARSFGEAFIREGDEIIIGEAEHHSNIVPWQQTAARQKARVVALRCEDDGSYSLERLKGLITEKTRIVCLAHASNVLGIVNDIRVVADICHAAGVPILVDGAQGAAHCPVDVQALGCDFYTFSAHKIYGPTGVGVLYGRKELLEQMPPFMSGGEMVGTVTLEKTTFAPLPMKFEAGTQNFNSVAALKPALEFARRTMEDEHLGESLEDTAQWLQDALMRIEGLRLYGTKGQKLPVFSFTIEGVHHEDLSLLLDKMGVAVRSGQMCAEPLMNRFGVSGMLRASLLPYNTREEAEYFVKALLRAVKMLK